MNLSFSQFFLHRDILQVKANLLAIATFNFIILKKAILFAQKYCYYKLYISSLILLTNLLDLYPYTYLTSLAIFCFSCSIPLSYFLFINTSYITCKVTIQYHFYLKNFLTITYIIQYQIDCIIKIIKVYFKPFNIHLMLKPCVLSFSIMTTIFLNSTNTFI